MSSSSDAGTIRTVLGDIPAAEAGHTQCHEHIFLRKGASFRVNPALCMDDMEKSLAELAAYQKAGGATIVDAQPPGCGRGATELTALSHDSGVSIVAVTGFHVKAFWDEGNPFENSSEETLSTFFEHEVTRGMTDPDGTIVKARAGVVKVALEEGGLRDKSYVKCFTAAAEAAGRSGAPVMVHTEKNADVMPLIRLFEEAGVSARRMIVCHLDRTHPDAGYHREVLQTGCYLCYDSVHRLKYVSDAEEIRMIRTMCEAGFGGGLLLSLDTTNRRLRAYGAADMGLDYILKTFIPALLENGVGADDVRRMCVINAQSALAMRKTQRKDN
jgi:phosphotriesterase-related protein